MNFKNMTELDSFDHKSGTLRMRGTFEFGESAVMTIEEPGETERIAVWSNLDCRSKASRLWESITGRELDA